MRTTSYRPLILILQLAARTPEQLAAAEKKEMNARKRKTLASLKRLTKSPSPPPTSDSEDLSEAEESVTATILAGLKWKEKPAQEKESEVQRSSEEGPRRTGRKRMPKTRDD